MTADLKPWEKVAGIAALVLSCVILVVILTIFVVVFLMLVGAI